MNVVLLSKSDLSILNKRSLKYQLADAEKDYMLALVVQMIYASPLKKKLVFKGGTAIHHCYLPQSRFSEDLDFTCVDYPITLDALKNVLVADFLEVKEEYSSEATLKIERLKYSGILGMPNSLKVEVDYKQNVVLSAKEITYNNPWKLNTKVMTMDEREVCAEKIRAASDRSRYRDFYDLFLLLENYSFQMDEIISLIKQKEIRKPISIKFMLANLKNALEEKNKELAKVYYARDISEKKFEKMIKSIPIRSEIIPERK